MKAPISTTRSLRIAFAMAVAILSVASIQAGKVRETPLDAEADYRRAIWVTRWDFKSPEDIAKICENAASLRFTDLLFQVRGAGTVFFNSPYEPWSWEPTGLPMEKGIGRSPGWDPLEVAVREGRRRGLRVHAWLNVMPAWAQEKDPPANSGQLYVKHKSWLMTDSAGRAMKPNGFYAFVEPGLPEVREHIALLVGQMVRDYQVDGVHLDYIRYPLLEETKRDVSHHPRVRQDFQARFNHTPEQAPEQWINFRTSNITQTVKGIRVAINSARPEVELTSTCMADPINRATGACQNPFDWIDDGLVDAVVPMAYVKSDLNRFDQLIEPFVIPARRDHAWVGIWPRSENGNFLAQIDRTARRQAGGVAVFAYSELCKNHKISTNAYNIYATFVGKQPTGKAVASASPIPHTSLVPAPSKSSSSSSGSVSKKSATSSLKTKVK